ncbi:MAG: methylenetetrahydrofolate reductase C-terminal domain-containing protein [Dehalococcoidia bacterium]|nr:methylenetetrahydrofolate reductase C-terminal domain-containing protein [Dehalococcoidia bacterium]
MTQLNRKRKILVVSNTPALADITRKATGAGLIVEHALNKAEARERVRATHPDLVILGRLEHPDDVWKFYGELREGWISRHSSVLVVELDFSDEFHRVLGDVQLEKGTSGYDPLAGPPGSLISKDSIVSGLGELIAGKLRERENKIKASMLGPGGFCLVWEQIPGLGAFEVRQEMVVENAGKAAAGGKICAISVTDNPGGNPAIATEVLSAEIRKLGVEPLVHIAFRDKSRNQCESLLYQLAAMNINNLLVLTGDYPSNLAFRGKSKPVFDLDSVNGLELISEMNRGMEHEIMRKKTTLAPTEFYAGVAFSPFKQEEAEVMGQYYKLKKKVRAGADFLITQVGYDVRKLHELRLWLKMHGHQIPALASIYVLSDATAKVMQANRVPGCVVTDKLRVQVQEESASPDRGRQARLDRAAKMLAIVRGMGFSGASISGQALPYENVEYILARAEEFYGSWPDLVHEFDYPQENGFYLFQRDPVSGLNLETPSPKTQKVSRSPVYFFSRVVHASVFEPKSPLFKVFQSVAGFIDSSRILKKLFGPVEFWIKAVIYSCLNCGDCAIFDVAYLCPVSQCPKNQRNGPCGGSYRGWCEVYPEEKKCIWVKAYRRLKAQGREDTIGGNIVPPCNWELWQSPSWLNYFMGRDHVSRSKGIKTVKRS